MFRASIERSRKPESASSGVLPWAGGQGEWIYWRDDRQPRLHLVLSSYGAGAVEVVEVTLKFTLHICVIYDP